MDPPLLIAGLFALSSVALTVALWRREHSPWSPRFRFRVVQLFGPFAIFSSGWIAMDALIDDGFRLRPLLLLGVFLGFVGFMPGEWKRLRRAVRAEAGFGSKDRPDLLWPFMAVLGPMLVLAIMAVVTLRMDRISAEIEAAGRAGEIAEAISVALVQSLQSTNFDSRNPSDESRPALLVLDPNSNLVQPSPWVWPPEPRPFTAEELKSIDPSDLEDFRAADAALNRKDYLTAVGLLQRIPHQPHRQASFRMPPLDPRDAMVVEAMEREMNEKVLPTIEVTASIGYPRFRQLTALRLAHATELALPELRSRQPGVQFRPPLGVYNDVFGGFEFGPLGHTESGVAIAPLVVLKILDLANDQFPDLPQEWHDHPERVIQELVESDASPMTVEAIDRLRYFADFFATMSKTRMSAQALFEPWDRTEQGRALYAEACDRLKGNPWPDVFWVEGQRRWLLSRQAEAAQELADQPTERVAYTCLPNSWLASRVGEAWLQRDRRGDYVVRVEIAGAAVDIGHAIELWGRARKVSAGWEPNEFTTTTASPVGPGRIFVGLADPRAYFNALQRRQYLLGALVSVALVAGSVAAWTLRRSLLQQVELNEQRSNFVSSVSHELRAPIASVRLMTESLERGTVRGPDQQQEYFRLIGQETRRLSSLITNVLDFSRMEQGRKQYEFEPTHLHQVVEETVALMQPYAAERNVKLALNTERGVRNAELNIDGRAIQQALVNLIDNAIKHSPNGESVVVWAEQSPDVPSVPTPQARGERDGRRASETAETVVRLMVEDRGPGIPQGEHERIFDRFYRLGSELRRETQGVGIGLSIVKHIVEAHGGRVFVESEVGKGSRFAIELPVGKFEVRDSKSETSSG